LPSKPTRLPNQFDVTLEEVADAIGPRFRMERQVRKGGQGIVFKAHRLATRANESAADVVALKVYALGTQLARVEREIDALERIRHTCTANLVEHGTINLSGEQTIYVACDFIEGTALDERLIAQGPVSYATVAVIGRDTAAALSALWAHRIVHRDVNPKNIMLRVGERQAILIDLGVARHVRRHALTSGPHAWGTEGYMSPEQNRAEQNLSTLSDVFSLGIVLQESLIGRHPNGNDQQGVMRRTNATEDLDPKVPEELAVTIDSMLSVRSSFRPAPAKLVEIFSRLATRLQ
jgi:eukaryotic-like serine/threonine-protein kinase